MRHFQTVEGLRQAYQARTQAAYDNYTLITGPVGSWKSLWARKFGRYVSRRPLQLNHIHFTQEAWMADFVTMAPGDSIIMDEFRAHKRQAMHGFRMEQLDTNKEGRQIGANAFFCYPDAAEIDNDILKRFEWWHHKPARHIVEVRRHSGGLAFDPLGKPVSINKWPIVARFKVTGENDPLRWPYEEKKDARMRDRASRYEENQPKTPPKGEEKDSTLELAIRQALLNRGR